jgi:branched-chain amino acid transport system substrate-binding protein
MRLDEEDNDTIMADVVLPGLTRRGAIKSVLTITAAVAGTALLAACGGSAAVSTSGTAATVSAALTTASSAATSSAAPASTASTTSSAATSSAATTSASAAPAAAGAGATAAIAKGGAIKIGIDLPITGADASDGVPAENGAKLAIDQANSKGTVAGYKLEAFVLDNAVNGVHDPAQGARNVQQFVGDNATVAFVGPFNSNVAKVEIPISNEAGIAQISPSATNEGLTKPQYGGLDLRKSNPTRIAFFRVCTTDDIQGPAGADYALSKLSKKAAYIVDDNETYGLGVANNFEKEFTAKGGKVLGHDHLTKGQTDFKSLLTKIKGANPDIVIYGGTTSTGGGLLRAQMPDAGLGTLPYLGFDGISDTQFLKDAGSAADNCYYTVAAVNAAKIPAAAQFITDYKAAYKSDIGAYSANCFDAANIIIAAIAKAAADGSVTREAVRANIAATKDFKGVIGTTSFDANGDTTNRIISIYSITKGQTTFADQITA